MFDCRGQLEIYKRATVVRREPCCSVIKALLPPKAFASHRTFTSFALCGSPAGETPSSGYYWRCEACQGTPLDRSVAGWRVISSAKTEEQLLRRFE